MRRKIAVLGVLGVGLLIACGGDDSSTPPPRADAGSDATISTDSGGRPEASTQEGGGGSDASVDVVDDGRCPGPPIGGSTCSSQAQFGANVTVQTADSGVPPTMTGGTLNDGYYTLTSMTSSQPVTRTLKRTLHVSRCGTQFEIRDDEGATTTLSAGTMSVNGSQLTMNAICQQAGTTAVTFTATTNSVTIVSGSGNFYVERYGAI